MSKPIVYLAGPISGLSYDQAIGWRVTAKIALEESFTVLSPMRGKGDLAQVRKLVGEYRQSLFSRSETIVMRDLTDVDRADALIVNAPGRSLGTCIEIGYALKAQKPIIVIADTEDGIREHPFIKHLPKLAIVETLDEAIAVVFSLFDL